MYVINLVKKSSCIGLQLPQLHLHCFALDGVTHQLFQPYGTHSLSDPRDLQMVQEMSYQDSLKSVQYQLMLMDDRH